MLKEALRMILVLSASNLKHEKPEILRLFYTLYLSSSVAFVAAVLAATPLPLSKHGPNALMLSGTTYQS